MTTRSSIVMHGGPGSSESLKAVLGLNNSDFSLFILGDADPDLESAARAAGKTPVFIPFSDTDLASALNTAVKSADSDFLMYIENRGHAVLVKKASLDLLIMAASRNPEGGYFYSDYEIEDEGSLREVRLLFHHSGRVRDNQDYGKLHFFRNSALKTAGGFDKNLKYNVLYDCRLKISETHELIRIGNKVKGSLCRVMAAGRKTNVFDYLMAGKDIQLEAEKVVTDHLKRIGAYLAPGTFRKPARQVPDRSSLEATVIIPVGQRPEFIGTAIDSIQAQTVKNIEAVIVVNGGETDPTAAEVRRYMKGGDLYDASKPEIRLIVVDINSIGFCLNLGAAAARGRYYVQLDSDDRLKPDAVEKVLKVFSQEKNVGMVIGSYEVWEKHADGSLTRMEQIPVVTHDEWTEDNGRNNLLRINGAGAPRCIPISVIEEMGWFSLNDDAFARNYGEDYEMVNKISEHYRIGRIYDPIYEVIRHSGGTDHAISQDLVDRNDEAKDDMRREAIARRIRMNRNSR